MLLLDNDDVRQVLDIGACLDALEEAYRAQAAGRALMRPRNNTYVPRPEPGLSYCLKVMEGAFLDGRYATLRLTSDMIRKETVHGVSRREKIARGPGGTFCGLILVFSIDTLEPVALLHDGYVQVFRVACTSALSARLLAREDAADLALLGTGAQAWAHVAAMNAVRPLRRARVHSPNPEHRLLFAERIRNDLGISAEACDTAKATVEGADLVVDATNASEPVVCGAWLAKGCHVVSIVSGDDTLQRRELDDDVIRRASIVISHSKEAAQAQRHGDLWGPVGAGILGWDEIHDLSELIAGRVRYRRQSGDITVFKNNCGIGMQFAAVAPRLYELALEKKIGRQLPAEWFLQTLKP